MVDVVIDNFDYGRFLGAAIDSALGQTYAATRVTVVDDGSGDDSLAIARGYGDRIRVVAKANGGQASALNAGFAATDGDLVAFLDADDMLCADFVERAVTALAAEPAAVKAVFRAEVVDAAGQPTGRVEPPAHLRLSSGDLRAATLSQAFDLVWPPLSAHVFRRSALAAVMPIPEQEFRTLADFYLAHTTSLLGDVAAVERAGARYRRHGSNAFLVGPAATSLAQVRAGIVHEERALRHVARVAAARGVLAPAGVQWGTAGTARRLISLRMDPAAHPLPGDTRRGLWRAGGRSVRRRAGLAPRTRATMLLWFTLTALAPRPFVPRLAALFLQPARRGPLARRLASGEGLRRRDP